MDILFYLSKHFACCSNCCLSYNKLGPLVAINLYPLSVYSPWLTTVHINCLYTSLLQIVNINILFTIHYFITVQHELLLHNWFYDHSIVLSSHFLWFYNQSILISVHCVWFYNQSISITFLHLVLG